MDEEDDGSVRFDDLDLPFFSFECDFFEPFRSPLCVEFESFITEGVFEGADFTEEIGSSSISSCTEG